MVYAEYVKDGKTYCKTYSCWDLYYEDTFSPDIEVTFVKEIINAYQN